MLIVFKNISLILTARLGGFFILDLQKYLGLESKQQRNCFIMRFIVCILLGLCLTGCNSIYLKPGTLDKNSVIYTPRGGYSMQRSIKQVMDERGYKTHVGKLKSEGIFGSNDTEVFVLPNNARYSVQVKEREEILRPIWCMFNGFWWWNFSISITDKRTGTEILSWRGRGCQNSSLRKLNDALDELEIKRAQ